MATKKTSTNVAKNCLGRLFLGGRQLSAWRNVSSKTGKPFMGFQMSYQDENKQWQNDLLFRSDLDQTDVKIQRFLEALDLRHADIAEKEMILY